MVMKPYLFCLATYHIAGRISFEHLDSRQWPSIAIHGAGHILRRIVGKSPDPRGRERPHAPHAGAHPGRWLKKLRHAVAS